MLLTAIVLRAVPTSFAERGGDAWVYLAAGERLNAGHDLYALVQGDRYVQLAPPLWPTPLLSPPPVAVLWRPLALIGEPAMGIWCLGAMLASVALVGMALIRGGPIALVLVVLFGPFLMYASLAGNANAYLAPLMAAAWFARRRPWAPAMAVVAGAAVKITPVALAPWLLPKRRLVSAIAMAATVLIASLLFARGATQTWLASTGVPAPSPLSLASLSGIDARAMTVAVVAGAWLAAIALRGNERAVFACGVIGATFATPAFYLHTLALLAALMVLDWPEQQLRTRPLAA